MGSNKGAGAKVSETSDGRFRGGVTDRLALLAMIWMRATRRRAQSKLASALYGANALFHRNSAMPIAKTPYARNLEISTMLKKSVTDNRPSCIPWL